MTIMSPDDDISSTLTATPTSSSTSSSSPSATPPTTPIQHKLDDLTTSSTTKHNIHNNNHNNNNNGLVQQQQQLINNNNNNNNKLIQNFDNLATKLNGKKWQIMPEKKETFLEEKNDFKNLYKLINSTDVIATITPPSSPTSRTTPTTRRSPTTDMNTTSTITTNNNNTNSNHHHQQQHNNINNINNNNNLSNSKLLNDHTTPLLLLDNDENNINNKKLDKNFNNNKMNKIIMNNNNNNNNNNNINTNKEQQLDEKQQELENQSPKKSPTPILLTKKETTNNGWKELSQDDDIINNFNTINNAIGNNNGSIINGKNGIGNGNGHSEQLAEEDPLTGNLNLKQLDDDELSNCGIGSCQPKWARPFASTHFFMVVFLLAWILQGMYCTYFVSVITTIEKLFQIQSKTTGLLMSATEIGQIGTALFLTYFAGRGHRPRWIACGILLFAISSFCCALPHFIYGDQILHASNIFNGHALQKTQTTTSIFNNKTIITKTDNFNLCYASDNNRSNFGLEKAECEEDILVEQVAHSQITVFVFIIFFFGLLGVGIGSTAVSTLGIPYIDDNVASRESPIYIAITIGVRILGPAAGFILGSFCTRIYVDLSVDPGFSPSNPKWVGAWWLGLVLISTLMATTSVAMFAFPKNLKGNRIPPPMKMRAIEAQKKIEKQEEEYKTPQLKDFPKTIKRQLSNDILMFRTASSVLHLLPVAGLYTFLPKYLESQFRLPAHDANLISGVCGILVMGVGIVISGVVILKFNPTARSVAGWIAFTAIVYACGMAILMFVGCPMDDFAGFKPNNQNPLPKFEPTCNLTCNCDFNKYSPICGSDGMIYFSPCHAGCSQLTTEKKQTQFYDCDCIPSVNTTLPTSLATEPKTPDATGGYCNGNCKNFLLFITLFCFFVFMHSTSEVGSMLLIMRCTDPKDKAMAMGIIQFAIGLFGNVPCPIIYGAVVDSACLVWETICGKQGACSLYDVNVFRHFFLGTTAGIMLLAFIMDLVVWHKAHRIDIDPESNSETEIDKPTNAPEGTV